MQTIISFVLIIVLMIITFHLVFYYDTHSHKMKKCNMIYLPKIVDKYAANNVFSPEELYIKEHNYDNLSFLDYF